MTSEEYLANRLVSIYDCPNHQDYAEVSGIEYCGCPRTNRTDGYLIFKDPFNAHNWIVWDVIQSKWVALCGDWQIAICAAYRRIWCDTYHHHAYGAVCNNTYACEHKHHTSGNT